MVMEAVTKNPGLQHIAEDIFNILEKKSLADCRLVNDKLEQANILVEEDKIRAYTRKFQILGNAGL